ncbi:unnamed protein product [Leuciscus chuanchicus]
MASTKANAKSKALQEHDYGGPERMETNTRGTKNTLASPSKSPAPQKKSKPDDVVTAGAHAEDASNAAILAAIGTLQNMMQDFKAELKQNTLTIANIAKAVEFNSAELKECKTQCQKLHVEVKQLKEENTDLGERAAELESYKRRWNLRVNGLQEGKDENTRQIISDIIGKIVPHWRGKMDFILDSVHRLGPSNTNRPRQILMQFTGRHFRDELWLITKPHPVCKHLNIRFAEDLTKEDRKARRAVWPKVEQARKAGLKTVFRRPHAFINGQRVYPGFFNPENNHTFMAVPAPSSSPADSSIPALPAEMRKTIPRSEVDSIYTFSSWQTSARLEALAPSPDRFFTHRLLVWMPYHQWKVRLLCPVCGKQLTGYGIHKRARKVLDIDRYYLMPDLSTSQTVLDQLDLPHRRLFRLILTYKYACDIRVIRLLRERTLGNSPARLAKQLKENHGEEWLDRLAHCMGECAAFVDCPISLPVVFQEPPEPFEVPTSKWLLTVYGKDIVSRLDHIKAGITSTFGTILKIDSTKKGSCANTLNFQLYLLEGLNRWNQDRAAASVVTNPSSLLTYAGDVVHCLNTNSLKVIGRKYVPTFQPPAKYTAGSCILRLASCCILRPTSRCILRPTSRCILRPASRCILRPDCRCILRPASRFILCPASRCILRPDCRCILRPASRFILRPASRCILRPDCRCILRPASRCILRPDCRCILRPASRCILRPDCRCILCPDCRCILRPTSRCILRPASRCILRPDCRCILRPASRCILRPDCRCILCPDCRCILRPTSRCILRPTSRCILRPASRCILRPDCRCILRPASRFILRPASRCILRPASRFILRPASRCILRPDCRCILRPASRCILRPDCRCILRPASRCILRPDCRCILRPASRCILRPDCRCILRPASRCIRRPDCRCILRPDCRCILRPASRCILRPDCRCILCPDCRCILRPTNRCILRPASRCILRPDCRCILRPTSRCILRPASRCILRPASRCILRLHPPTGLTTAPSKYSTFWRKSIKPSLPTFPIHNLPLYAQTGIISVLRCNDGFA